MADKEGEARPGVRNGAGEGPPGGPCIIRIVKSKLGYGFNVRGVLQLFPGGPSSAWGRQKLTEKNSLRKEDEHHLKGLWFRPKGSRTSLLCDL
ncbi:sorting nexin-27-like [Ammospiza nelsoni]|uniref:sorting nexin-27-like n=1 Tax=Ammospiza nelsoni TaxID=2857394 RepID=UPI00286AA923|nr:sorting nexin-27-like [Ammospiza nelsoni]